MSTTANSQRRQLLVLLAWCLLLLLAWGLWLWRLEGSDLTFDEAATYVVAHRPLLDVLKYLRGAVREHPPVYYLLIHTWMALAGTSEFSLRFFSVGVALLGLTLTGWLARLAIDFPPPRRGGVGGGADSRQMPQSPPPRRGGVGGGGTFLGIACLLPAALLAFIPGMAYYARDARMYSLGIVWTILSAGLFLRDWLPSREWPRPVALASLVAVHLLALFTHYYLLLPILVQPLILLITRRWRPFLAWCALHILLALAGLGWLWLAPGLQMTTGGFRLHLTPFMPTRFQAFRLTGKILFSPIVRVRFMLLYRLLALAGGGILIALWRRRPVGVWLPFVLLVPPVLAFQVPHPPAERYLIFLLPFVALALGFVSTFPLWLQQRWLARLPAQDGTGGPASAGESPLKRSVRLVCRRLARFPVQSETGGPASAGKSPLKWSVRRVLYGTLAWGVAAGLTLGLGYMLASGGLYQAVTLDRSRYGRTLETVKAYARPGDGLLFYGPWQWIMFQYYDPGGLPPITTLPPQAPPRLKPAEAEPVLEKLLAQHTRLWVIPAAVDDVDPHHFVAGWLRTHAHAVWETDDFSLYLPVLPADAPTQHLGLTFGQALVLEQVAYEPQPIPAGEPLRLTMYWSTLRRLENEVRLALALVGQDGQVWNVAQPVPGAPTASPATWQPGQAITDCEGLIVPQGVPPGAYVVRLMVNDDVTKEPLLVEGNKEIDLLTIQVTEPTHAPVLYGLPHPNAAVFCSPEGGACLTLAGYEPGGLRFQPGHSVLLTLHWLVPNARLPEVQLRLQVLHRPALFDWQTTPVITRTLPLTSRSSPEASARPLNVQANSFRIMLPIVMRAFSPSPSDWVSARLSGRLVTLPIALTLPPDALTGPAQVALQVFGPDGLVWPTTEGTSTFPLFNVTVEGRPTLRQLPRGLTPIQADFGAEVGLRGYRVEGDPRPGGQLHLTYAWYAQTRPTIIYAVFNHLVTADGTAVAQADGWPQEGRMLSIQWQPGEYIEDHYTLTIPPDAPPGPYTLYVGLYNAANNERQPAFLDGQRLPEDRLPIPLPGEEGR